MQVVNQFRFLGADVHVLDNGQAVRVSITGAMLLSTVGGKVVSLHDTLEQAITAAEGAEALAALRASGMPS